VKLLANPLLIRMVLMLFAMAFVFVMAAVAMRKMRSSLTEEASFAEQAPTSESFPLHTYHAVIQQLKQQKHELQTSQQAERRRAKTSENISAAVLSNLSCGFVFFTPDGLVRQANAAAKQILGFASPLGVNAAQLFREASVEPAPGATAMSLAEAIQSGLQGEVSVPRLESRYFTPGGVERALDIVLTPVLAPNAEVLGAACLINDLSEIVEIRREQRSRQEVSAEMALDLHNSLNTISGYARQLAASREPDLARQLAEDIAAEADLLEHSVGSFLAGTKTASSAAGN
jgi:PAS domain S-box-containing protein